MSKIFLTHAQVEEAATIAGAYIRGRFGIVAGARKMLAAYAVPRGGIPAAYLMLQHVGGMYLVDNPEAADLFIDDMVDSGRTRAAYDEQFGNKPFFALYDKNTDWPFPRNSWLVFPWEGKNEMGSCEDIPVRLLQYIGEDVKRGGLADTPARFLKAWKHWTSGYFTDAATVLKTFEDGAEACDELVLVKDIPVYSQCEHHLAPFFGVAHIGYIPNGKIVGLSKMSRLVDVFARRLQVQERLTNQIADAIRDNLQPLGVGVVLECRHMCMESRGIQRQGATTVTSAMHGALREEASARSEFLTLIKGSSK